MNNTSPDPLFHKPQSIVAAKNILYSVMFLAILTWVLGRLSHDSTTVPATQTVVTLIITLAVLFVLIKCVTRGMKWARVVLLVLFLLGLIPFIWVFPTLWRTSLLIAVLSLLQAILEGAALIFLFRQESTLWFNRVNEKSREEPNK